MELDKFHVHDDDAPPIETIIGGGVSWVVYALDDDTVLKSATGLDGSVHDLEVERRIYERLGLHPCILQLIRVESRGLVLERWYAHCRNVYVPYTRDATFHRMRL